jgi:hypothetical protein
MESIFKMTILRFPFSPSEPYIFDIFKPINLKFGILMKNYIKTNETFGFFDKLSISYGIELELGPSRIKGFFFIFSAMKMTHFCFGSKATSILRKVVIILKL